MMKKDSGQIKQTSEGQMPDEPSTKDAAKDAQSQESKSDEKLTSKEMQKISQERDDLLADRQELTDCLQRLQAEFENYRKRIDKESEQLRSLANEELVKSLLPILDNFELALGSSKRKDEFFTGMELIFSQLVELLEQSGLEPIDCEDKRFDPRLHEALLTQACDEEKNKVLEVLQKGYLFQGRVLRHSKVKISTGKRAFDGNQKKSDEDKDSITKNDEEDIENGN